MSAGSFSSSRSGGDASAAGSNNANPYSMFPTVEKTYRVRITEDIERDLKFLGQSRVDALTSNFDMTLVKDKGNVQLYELQEKEFFTMRGVTTVNAPLDEVMQLLRMDTTAKLRDVMGDIFGTLFLDGVVLYKSKDTRKHESLSVNWTALQSSKRHLPHRDYVFLRYGDVFEKSADHGSHSYNSQGSGLYIGASVWESIELDGTDPLPASQNVVRLKMRRCGIVVEETSTVDEGVKVSFYLSEAHPGRAAVSTLTRAWMTKLVSCTAEISNVIVARALASSNILSKNQFVKDGVNCYICVKSFSLLRRKHHCRICGDVVCSKCSEVKNLKQGGMNKEVRVCLQCRNSSTASIRSSGSDSRTLRSNGGSSKPSFSNYSMASSDASVSYDEDTSNYGSMSSMSAHTIHENSLSSDSNSESARVRSYPSHQRNGGVRPGPEQPKLLSKTSSMNSSDMILLSKQTEYPGNDMILLSKGGSGTRSVTDSSGYSEFGMYTNDGLMSGLSPEEMAEMELASTVRHNTPFNYALSYTSRQEWPKAPLPMNEALRLKKVRELHLADPGQHFQEMCEYAAAEMGCQMAAICFIGDKSGFLMAKVGSEKREVPRNVLFDSHTIMSEEPTIILDATEDLRFMNNPLVTEGQVRFYAGFPMITSDGYIVGSFCVADPFARESLSGDKFFFLKNLADVAIRGVEQNTVNQISGVIPTTTMGMGSTGSTELGNFQVPPPPAMNISEAHQTMQELLKTAYSTQVQVRMQVNPLTK